MLCQHQLCDKVVRIVGNSSVASKFSFPPELQFSIVMKICMNSTKCC